MWIGRNNQYDFELWDKKPICDMGQFKGKTSRFDGYLTQFCYEDFKKITGITLEPEELRKVKITKFKEGFKFELVWIRVLLPTEINT